MGDEMLDKQQYNVLSDEPESGFFSFLGNKIKDILAGDVVP